MKVEKVNSRIAKIQKIGVCGSYVESEDKQYLLVLQDSNSELGIGGYRHSGNGKFALAEKGQVIHLGECERPANGCIANTGAFAVLDILFGENTNSKLYVYSKNGTLLFSHSFSANPYGIGISDDGTHVSVQLCNSNTNDSSKLFLFDIHQGKIISSFIPQTGWSERQKFDTSKSIIYLCNEKRNKKRRIQVISATGSKFKQLSQLSE